VCKYGSVAYPKQKALKRLAEEARVEQSEEEALEPEEQEEASFKPEEEEARVEKHPPVSRPRSSTS